MMCHDLSRPGDLPAHSFRIVRDSTDHYRSKIYGKIYARVPDWNPETARTISGSIHMVKMVR